MDTLRRHRFDVAGDEVGTVPVSLEEMPSLSDVIREAEFYSGYLRQLKQY